MTECTKCNTKIEDDETCYEITIVRGSGEEPGTGVVENEYQLCEDCFFMSDFN